MAVTVEIGLVMFASGLRCVYPVLGRNPLERLREYLFPFFFGRDGCFRA